MIQAYIDRLEEDKAVLLWGDDADKVVFPAKYLPDEAGEGDYVNISMTLDRETTEAAEDEALALLKETD